MVHSSLRVDKGSERGPRLLTSTSTPSSAAGEAPPVFPSSSVSLRFWGWCDCHLVSPRSSAVPSLVEIIILNKGTEPTAAEKKKKKKKKKETK